MKKKVVVLTVFMLLLSIFCVNAKVSAKGIKNQGEAIKVEIKSNDSKRQVEVNKVEEKSKDSKSQVEVNKTEEKGKEPQNQVEVSKTEEKSQDSKNQVEGSKVEEQEKWGKDYIEVNIEEQEISMYLNGKLIISGPVVTGTADTSRETPTGVFSILEKDYDVVLEGADYSSHVTYWMQIYGGIGIHDADEWRSEYGGDIYLYSGSHGCINVPLEIVEVIYENAYIGMTVIVN